jgi:hypothetical protein
MTAMDPVAVELALAPFIAFVVIVGAFIYFKN